MQIGAGECPHPKRVSMEGAPTLPREHPDHSSPPSRPPPRPVPALPPPQLCTPQGVGGSVGVALSRRRSSRRPARGAERAKESSRSQRQPARARRGRRHTPQILPPAPPSGTHLLLALHPDARLPMLPPLLSPLLPDSLSSHSPNAAPAVATRRGSAGTPPSSARQRLPQRQRPRPPPPALRRPPPQAVSAVARARTRQRTRQLPFTRQRPPPSPPPPACGQGASSAHRVPPSLPVERIWVKMSDSPHWRLCPQSSTRVLLLPSRRGCASSSAFWSIRLVSHRRLPTNGL